MGDWSAQRSKCGQGNAWLFYDSSLSVILFIKIRSCAFSRPHLDFCDESNKCLYTFQYFKNTNEYSGTCLGLHIQPCLTCGYDDDDIFKVFSAPRLAPSTQRLQPRIHSVHSTFTKMSYKFPHPSEPFITSFSSLYSRTARQFGRNSISLQASRTTPSVSYVTDIRQRVHSYLSRFIIQSLRTSHEAVYFEMLCVHVPSQWRLTLSHLNLLLCHSPVCSAKLSVQTEPLHHGISSPSSPHSALPSTPTPMSHIRCHIGPPPRSCFAGECARDGQFSVFPLCLYVEIFNVHLQGVDLKTCHNW